MEPVLQAEQQRQQQRRDDHEIEAASASPADEVMRPGRRIEAGAVAVEYRREDGREQVIEIMQAEMIRPGNACREARVALHQERAGKQHSAGKADAKAGNAGKPERRPEEVSPFKLSLMDQAVAEYCIDGEKGNEEIQEVIIDDAERADADGQGNELSSLQIVLAEAKQQRI